MLKSLRNLALARQAEFLDGTQRVYLHVLQDVDSRLVSEACGQLALRPRAEFEPAMPTVGDVRAIALELGKAEAEAARMAKLLPLPKREDDEPRYFCLECRDEPYSWRPFWCPGTSQSRDVVRPEHVRASLVDCGRVKEHKPHDYVARCECRDVNPVAAQARERMTVARAKRPERRQHA